MDQIVDNKKCCGCHACANICPKKAITMQEDNNGFKHPTINKEKCINCGLCKKVCPVLNSNQERPRKINAYACYNKNINDRINSSSGGIFILLAKEILKKGGVVCGAAFDSNYNVSHMFVNSEKELGKLMGSKYVQSTIGDTYAKAKEYLDQNKYVLFSGTPCQIEGLKFFLKKEYDKLYLQDIICHGVPSPKVWQKYLEYQKAKNKSKIYSISHRNKDKSWSLFQMKIKFKNKTYAKDVNNDEYLRLFLNNICLRDSCYDCSFKKKYRESDLTLADYWGIDKVHTNMNDEKGTSLVIINSEKGQRLFNMIKNELVCIETNINKALEYNSAMVKSVPYYEKKDNFFNDINILSFGKIVKKYTNKKNLILRAISKIKRIIKKQEKST